MGFDYMKIGLISDYEKYPNLALMKISNYHKTNRNKIEWATIGNYDIIYISKVFDFSIVSTGFSKAKNIFIGGSGHNIKKKLPSNIESCQPDYSIYDIDYSIQFFSRGCIRSCPFCIVSEKEGYIKSVDPMNLNPNGKRIDILDNNFFANPEWKSAIKYLKDKKQPVNFMGIDVRILTEEQALELNKLKHYKQIHIAWDNPKDDVLPKIKNMIKYIKPYKVMCCVLIGFWSTPEEDMLRVEKLREIGVDPFVMPFNKKDIYQKKFARWVNRKAIFKSVKWEDYNK